MKFPSDAVVVQGMVICSAPCRCMVVSMPTWRHQITYCKSGYLWMGSWTCISQCCEAKLTDYVFTISVSSWFLPLSAYCHVLFMSIKAGLHTNHTSDIVLSLCVSLSVLCFCDTSTQGEASQYSPTGGCLRDQKGVLPLPWTVSLDVWWAGGKGSLLVFAVTRACWTLCVDYIFMGNELL